MFLKPPGLIVVLLCTLLSDCAARYVVGMEVPPEIVQALTENAKKLSPVTAKWEVQRVVLVSLPDLSSMLGIDVSQRPDFQEFDYFRFQNGKSYAMRRTEQLQAAVDDKRQVENALNANRPNQESRAPNSVSSSSGTAPKFVKTVQTQEVSIDLENWYNATGPIGYQDRSGSFQGIMISLLTDVRRDMPESTIVWPDYFYQAGYKFPALAKEQGELQQSLLLYMLEKGSTLVEVQDTRLDDRRCMFIEVADNAKRVQFWLDPSRKYAVLQRKEYTVSNELIERSSCLDFEHLTRNDLWLPKTCQIERHRIYNRPQIPSSRTIAQDTYSVQSFDFERMDDAIFDLRSKYNKPGTAVADRTLPDVKQLPSGQVDYRIPADPSQLETAINDAIKAKKPATFHLASGLGILVIFNLIIALLVATVFILRRMKKTS